MTNKTTKPTTKPTPNIWQTKRYLIVFCLGLTAVLAGLALGSNTQTTVTSEQPKEAAPIVAAPTPEPTPVAEPVVISPAPAPAPVAKTVKAKTAPPAGGSATKPASKKEVVVAPSFGILATRLDNKSQFGYFAIKIKYQRFDGYANSLPAPKVVMAPAENVCQLFDDATDEFTLECDLIDPEPLYNLTFSATDSFGVTKLTNITITWPANN